MPLRFGFRTILFTIIALAALVSQAFVLNLVAATPLETCVCHREPRSRFA